MRVGFVGLGTMGAPMARNLLRAGFKVAVHNRTRSREIPLASEGARRAASPKGAATKADVVVTMVSDTPDVEALLFGDQGVVKGAPKGSVVVDMSTISPDATRGFGERLAGHGIRMVDAPVSGGSEGAEQGTLTIMAGGEAEDVDRVRPVLDAVGSKVTHVGRLGDGQSTKMLNQVIVAGTFLAVAEGVVLGLKAGLDMERALEAIGTGAARSWALEHRAPNMIADRYPLGFRLSLHRKDLAIVFEAARRLGVDLPLATLVDELESRLEVEGRGDEDFSVIAAEIRRRAGL